jgi:hypothetical protein
MYVNHCARWWHQIDPKYQEIWWAQTVGMTQRLSLHHDLQFISFFQFKRNFQFRSFNTRCDVEETPIEIKFVPAAYTLLYIGDRDIIHSPRAQLDEYIFSNQWCSYILCCEMLYEYDIRTRGGLYNIWETHHISIIWQAIYSTRIISWSVRIYIYFPRDSLVVLCWNERWWLALQFRLYYSYIYIYGNVDATCRYRHRVESKDLYLYIAPRIII